jgi:hypothetical protein
MLVFGAEAHSAAVVVTNTTDVINGNTSSPETLFASPGADGTLRDAVEACQNARGPHSIAVLPHATS